MMPTLLPPAGAAAGADCAAAGAAAGADGAAGAAAGADGAAGAAAGAAGSELLHANANTAIAANATTYHFPRPL